MSDLRDNNNIVAYTYTRPEPPLHACQVCGESIAPEADAQDYCDVCNPDTPIQVMDDPNDGPIPADLLPPQTRIASVRIACEAPHLVGDGGAAPDMQDYARRDRINALARELFARAFDQMLFDPDKSWPAIAGVCLEAAEAFEEVTHNG